MAKANSAMRLALLLLAVAGLAGLLLLAGENGEWRVRTADRAMRDELLRKTSDIAGSLNRNLLRQLTFTPADAETPAGRYLRGRLHDARRSDPQVKWLYLMVQRGPHIVFGIDNVEPGEPDYTLPGDTYLQPPPELHDCFRNSRALVVGPYTDEWGAYVSAFVPVVDPLTGELLMFLGMDVPAADWQDKVEEARRGPLLAALLLLAGILAGSLALRRYNSRPLHDTIHFRTWLTVPAALAMLGSMLLLGIYEYREWQEQDSAALAAGSEQRVAEWQRLLADRYQMLGVHVRQLAADPALQQAMAARNRQALAARAVPLFAQLQRDHGVTHLNFIAPDRTCRLRAQQPDRHGDVVERAGLKAAVATGEDIWGIEAGISGIPACRYVHPWREQGRLLGYLEIGIELINPAIDFARPAGRSAFLMLRKDLLTREQFAAALAADRRLALAGDWDATGDYALLQLAGAELPDGVREWLGASHACTTDRDIYSARLQGRLLAVDVIHLPDPRGGAAAANVILMRESPLAAGMARSELLLNLGLVLAVMGGVLALLWTVAGVAQRQLADSFTRVRASEEQFHNMFRDHHAVMLLIEPDSGRIIDANDAALRFYGYARDKFLALGVQDLSPLPPETVAAGRRRAMQTGLSGEVFPHCLASGGIREVAVYSSPVAVQGKILLFSIIQDITERLRAEEQLRENETRYTALFTSMSNGVAVYRAADDGEDFYFVNINPAGERLSKIVREQVLGRSLCELFPAVKQMGLFAAMQQAWRTGQPQYVPSKLYQDERIAQWVENHVYKLPSGEIINIYDDVTEQRRLELLLRASEEHFRQLTEDMPLYVCSFLPGGQLTYANPALAKALGEGQDELVGKNFLQWLIPDDRREVLLRLAGLTPDRPLETHEQCSSVPDGIRWQQWTNRAFFDASGRAVRFQGVGQDITERKLLEQQLRESEEKFRTLTGNLNVGIYRNTGGPQGRFLYMNDAHARMLGYRSAEECMAAAPRVADLYQDPAERLKFVELLAARGHVRNHELRLRQRDGTPFWASLTVTATYDASGALLHMDGAIEDISTRKRLMEELHGEYQFSREIMEQAASGIVVYDGDLRVVVWNSFMEALTGVPAREVLGQPALDCFPHLREQGMDKLIRRALSGETVTSPDTPFHIPQSGMTGWVVTSYSPHRDAAGSIVGAIATVRNITERKTLERQLRDSGEMFKSLFASSPVAVVIYDKDNGEIIAANPAALAAYGLATLAELQTTDRWLDPPYSQAEALRLVRLVYPEGEQHFEWPGRRKNGGLFWEDVRLNPITINGLPRVLATSIDITQRKWMEEQLRASEEKYRALVEHAQEAIFVVRDGVLRYVNASFARIAGVTEAEAIGREINSFLPEEEHARVREHHDRVIADGQTPEPEIFQALVSGGERRWIQVSSTRIMWQDLPATLNLATDITGRKQAEEALIRSERLAAVGQLAAGVAHEFNNLLGAIRNHAYSIRRDPALAGKVAVLEKIVAIEAQTMRGNEVARGIMNLARPTPSSFRRLPVDELVEGVLRVQREELASESIVVEKIVPDGLRVTGDAGKIQQVLLNLVINARHAMRPRGGTLTVSAEATDKDVRLVVADTGCGISAEHMPKLFTPFFTTKGGFADNDLGLKGDGLGLPICHTIMREHGGRIEVTSDLGRGSRFTLVFPA